MGSSDGGRYTTDRSVDRETIVPDQDYCDGHNPITSRDAVLLVPVVYALHVLART